MRNDSDATAAGEAMTTPDLPPLPNSPRCSNCGENIISHQCTINHAMLYAEFMRAYALAAIAPYKAEIERLKKELTTSPYKFRLERDEYKARAEKAEAALVRKQTLLDDAEALIVRQRDERLAVLAAEREACATLVEEGVVEGFGYIETTGDLLEALAAAIRARGTA